MKIQWRRVGWKIVGIIAAIILGGILCRWVIIPLYLPGMPGVLHGPLSSEKALSYEWLRPLYSLDANTSYANLDTTYYYQVSMAERAIYTYFTENTGDKIIRVAKMESFISMPNPYKIESSDRKVPIHWSSFELVFR